MTPDDQRQWFSTTQVADYLDVNVKTIRQSIREGRLKATMIRSMYRINIESLREYLGVGPDYPLSIQHMADYYDRPDIPTQDELDEEDRTAEEESS